MISADNVAFALIPGLAEGLEKISGMKGNTKWARIAADVKTSRNSLYLSLFLTVIAGVGKKIFVSSVSQNFCTALAALGVGLSLVSLKGLYHATIVFQQARFMISNKSH